MMQLCLSYHGLAVFFHKKTTHLQWLNMIAAYLDSRFKFGLQLRYPDKIVVILPRTFQINGDRTKQTSLNVIYPVVFSHHLHRYRLLPLTQHDYGYFQKLRVSIESDLHRAFFYRILKIKVNFFYLTDL
jgi:hypothetical protein